MTTLAEIEQAVATLPSDQLAAFRDWFDRFDADLWDRRLAADAAAGKLDGLAAEALADLKSGDVRDL